LLAESTTGVAHALVTWALDTRLAAFVFHPLTGFVLYALLIPFAHLTSFYNYTLTHEVAHDNEHVLFLVVGYLFWRPVVATEPTRHRLHPGLRLVYLMAAIPVDTFSGLALTFSKRELFPAYMSLGRTWGPGLVLDLHIGGTIMWVGGDTLMVLAMIPICIQWVRYEDERTRVLDAELDAAARDAEGRLPTTQPGPASRHMDETLSGPVSRPTEETQPGPASAEWTPQPGLGSGRVSRVGSPPGTRSTPPRST
jgi:cytochrome c oxidase assembly factor CtaG